MRIFIRALWIGIAATFGTVGAAAQDKADEISQGFRAYIVVEPKFVPKDVRNRSGKMQDLVTDNGLHPTIAVFSRAIPADEKSPVGEVVKTVDRLAEKHKRHRFGAYAVFLALKDEYRKDETRDARRNEVAQFAAGADTKRTTVGLAEATVIPDGTNQPLIPQQVQKMGIGAEDDIVVIFYDKFRVLNRWKFKAANPPSADDLKAIEAAVNKHMATK